MAKLQQDTASPCPAEFAVQHTACLCRAKLKRDKSAILDHFSLSRRCRTLVCFESNFESSGRDQISVDADDELMVYE